MSDFDFDDDNDFDFDDARSAYVAQDDLQGRLLLITPSGTGTRTSKTDGKEYTYVISDVVILDGDVSDIIEDVPMELDDFQFSGVNLVGQLTPKIKKGRKVLGRLSRKPAQQKGFTQAWILADPTEADKVLARKYLKDAAARAKKQDLFD